MRRLSWNILLLILVMLQNSCKSPENEYFNGENAYKMAEAQMEFGPRPPGSEASERTAEWITSTLTVYGWRVEEQVFEYRGVSLKNLTGIWEPDPGNHTIKGGNQDITPVKPILLGAHYDTRPHADLDPVDPKAPVPGANDGASGVAVLLELARTLSVNHYPGPVWLVFFDGEDSGRIDGWDWIVGSSHYAEVLEIEPQAVIIVDMVGDQDLNLYYEKNSDPGLATEIWQLANQLGYEAFNPESKYAILDDHIPFLNQGWPAVVIIDFDYPMWHTQNDTMDHISADSLEAVGVTLEQWLWLQVETDH